ncbi:MAG: PilN domain-containing protein [Methylococcales bacterium]|nr:PilN domain-containing protein [Methylococcales bacterium]
MARINLLPWRDDLRKQKQKNFIVAMMASLGVVAFVMFNVHGFYESNISTQKQRNNYLLNEISIMNKKIKEIKELDTTREKLKRRMGKIQQLEGSRTVIVHIFDELPKVIPEGVYLETLSRIGSQLTISGIADSEGRVSNFMRSLEASDWLSDPRLTNIETMYDNNEQDSKVKKFTLSFRVVTANKKEEDDS